MDRIERIPSSNPSALSVAIQAMLDGRQAKMWTALPAYATAFDASKLTVSAQPTIQAQVRQPSGVWVTTNMPLCVDCPVMFPGGGGYVLTFPIANNDEGLLIFASRCIDSWWQSGGIQAQAELRMHDLSDGFFLPTGGMSNSKIPAGVSATATELRSLDGKDVVHIEPGLAELSTNNGATKVVADDNNKKATIVSAATSVEANGITGRVNVTAAVGLWVNGVRVAVP